MPDKGREPNASNWLNCWNNFGISSGLIPAPVSAIIIFTNFPSNWTSVYDKVAEIEQQSHKTWFFDLWGQSDNVWCIEWQARKALLRRFGARTFVDLAERQGDVLRYLASEHDTLRVPNEDSNRARWPLHPLWVDLQEQISRLAGLGVYREIDPETMLNERLIRISMSMYGYLKRIAAIQQIKSGADFVSKDNSVDYLRVLINKIHDPMTWGNEVQKRADQMRLGQ